MKSINRAIYINSKEIGLNAVFGKKASSLRFEVAGLLFFALLWIALSFFFFTKAGSEHLNGFLPLPTFKALINSMTESRFWLSAWASFRRVFVGIFIATIIGVPTGIAIGYYPRLRSFTYSPIQFVRMISPLSWMPVALLIFASFESAVSFLIVMACVCPIILNTAIGVLNVNPQWIKMALNQGAGNIQLIRTIIIPYSIPYMLTSVRLALGIAWIVLVPAEFLGVSSGLGYLINDARDTMEYDRLMAMIIAIGILGFSLDRILQKIQSIFSWTWTE
ncbi:MAG: ABC transporter permease [Desulfobacteraceae bacterium]|nr:ABC transporter permease [Desulfobacteraceae bacterium]